MNRTLQLVILATVFCTTAVADDELDAALAAQKKKAGRRTYSASAILHNQGLLVPAGKTEEEKSLDAKIRALDKKIGSVSAGIDQRARAPRPLNTIPRQEDPNNWLTPALLDHDAAENGPTDPEAPTWITEELDRQKLIQLEKAALEENTDLINQQLRGGVRPAEGAQYDQLKSYDRALKNILSGSMPETRRTPSTGTSPAPSPTIGVPSYLTTDRSTPVEQKRSLGPAMKLPQRTTQTRTLPSQGPGKSKSIWDAPEPLTPLKKLRQRTPLRENPFTEDYMPKTKRSIWD